MGSVLSTQNFVRTLSAPTHPHAASVRKCKRGLNRRHNTAQKNWQPCSIFKWMKKWKEIAELFASTHVAIRHASINVRLTSSCQRLVNCFFLVETIFGEHKGFSLISLDASGGYKKVFFLFARCSHTEKEPSVHRVRTTTCELDWWRIL